MALTMPFADATDLAGRWRPLSAEELTRAGLLLSDASQLILDEDERGIFSDLVNPAPLTLVRVVCAMVKRAMLAGEQAGATQTQQTIGPFGTSTTYSNPTGDLYLTSAERRALGFTTQRAGGVDMWSAGA